MSPKPKTEAAKHEKDFVGYKYLPGRLRMYERNIIRAVHWSF
jgi:hypothetical protein